jgi:hypothetical protein
MGGGVWLLLVTPLLGSDSDGSHSLSHSFSLTAHFNDPSPISDSLTDWLTDCLTAWLLNCCWPSPAQWFLVPSPTGTMSTLYCLACSFMCSSGRMSMLQCLQWLSNYWWGYTFIMMFSSHGDLCNISVVSTFKSSWILEIPSQITVYHTAEDRQINTTSTKGSHYIHCRVGWIPFTNWYISLRFHLMLSYNFVSVGFPTQANIQPTARYQSSYLSDFIQFCA